MNKNQKQILKIFYDAYLTGEDSLRKAIKERIDVLEKETIWKRELKDKTTTITSGYISKRNAMSKGVDSTIVFDDDGIYYIFLTNLFDNKFNIKGQVYSKIKEALLKTSLEYFGETIATAEQRDDSYLENKDNRNKLSKFKNKGMAYCLEEALIVQNIMALLGIKSYIIGNSVWQSEIKQWGLHAYNIIRYDGKSRLIDIALGIAYTYKNDECVKREIWDQLIYFNDIHRIANSQRLNIRIFDEYINIDGSKEYKKRSIRYGNIASEEKEFRRLLRTRTIDKELDNKFLNKTIGGKRNLMREKELFGANTVMAYLIIPVNIVDDNVEYCKLENLVLNGGNIQEYIEDIYLANVRPDSRKNSKMLQFDIEYVIKDIAYKGKDTKMLILKLPMSNTDIYKFETIYSAVIFDDTFPRVFNLTNGYPTEKRESNDVVLHEVLNTMQCPIEPLQNSKIETFIDSVVAEINKENCIVERELEKYFNDYFDIKYSSKTYKLALDIYNKGLMRSDFDSNKKVVKYYTKISCDKCNRFCMDIDEFPDVYNAKEYMGYMDMSTRNLNCEFIKSNIVCPFRLLSFIERLLLNTKITPDEILSELIKIQTKRESFNEGFIFKDK